jgi:hypothetical protein
MDPEIQREFEEQLRQMSDMLSQINSTMAGTVRSIQTQTSAISGNTTSVRNQTQANNQLSESVSGRTKAEEAASIANEKFSKTTDNLVTGFKAVGSSLVSFGSAIRDASAGYSKYSSGITQLTGGISSLLGGFGFFGKAIGVAVSAVGSIAAPILEYNDALLKGYDDLSKFGAGAGLSAEQIMQLGHDANISSKKLSILTDNAKELNRGLIAMGGSFTAGVQSFSTFIGLTNDQIKQYRNLGFSHEELVESMTKYAAMQAKAGNSMVQTPQQLQKASLAYIDNLVTLAELTGVDVAKMQDAQNQALADENFNAYIFKKQLERDRTTDEAEKAKIQAIIDAKTEYAGTAKATLDATTAAARIQAISTDGMVNITESNAVLSLQQADIQAQQDKLMKGESQALALQEDNYNIQSRLSDQYGDMAAELGQSGKDIQQTFGMTNEARESANLFKKNQAELAGLSGEARLAKLKELKEEAAARVQGTKGKTTGATADDATKQALERQLNIMTEQFLDPLAAGARKLINEGLEKAVDAFTTLNNFLNDDFMTTLRKLKEFFDGLPTTVKTVSAALLGLVGASVLGKVVIAFRGLGLAAGGLGSVFGKLKGAFSGAIGWLKSLLGMGGSPSAPGGGKLLKLAKVAAGGIGGLLGGLALDYGAEKASEAGHTRTAAGLSTGSSALTGASMGAMLGSVVPGVGTLAGGAVGGLMGGAYGLYQNWGGLTGGSAVSESEQEKVKKTTTMQENTATKNEKTTDKTIVSNEKTSTENKKTTAHFARMVAAFGKIVAANGKIVVAFADLVKLFGESVKTFDATIKDLMTKFGDTFGLIDPSSTIGATVSGVDPKDIQTATSFFTGRGYTPAQAAGIVGNLVTESKLQTNAVGDGGKAYGIAQWHPDRQAKFKEVMKKDIRGSSLEDQLKFIDWELKNTESAAGTALANTTTAAQAASVFDKKYERSSGAAIGERIANANAIYSGNLSGTDQSSPGSDAIVQLGRALEGQGLLISGHTKFGGMPAKGVHAENSRHYRDLAIDINAPGGITEANNPEWAKKFNDLAVRIQNMGFAVKWNDDPAHDNHIHASVGPPEGKVVKAARGGVFSGASSGYPATLHGTEMVAPLTMDSILMKLAKTSALSAEGDMIEKALTGGGTGAAENSNTDAVLKMHSELISVLTNKLDSMIDVLDDGNDTRDKIFKHSMV